MNRLTLAVAGGRKTQSIIDHCAEAPPGRRILVVTYTRNNQQELCRRLNKVRPLQAQVEVQGWFSFLLGHWVRPYLPLRFPGRRLRGFIFNDDDLELKLKGAARFLDSEGRAYKRHLALLALETNEASSGAVLDRLGGIYDEIYIDEVQDLNGYALEVLFALLDSPIEIRMVGDIRQALIQTDIRDQKNEHFKGIKIGEWFKQQEAKKRLNINRESTTWRSNQVIASFADTIFDKAWGFPATISESEEPATGHDGVFAVASEHVDSYFEQYRPLCLRYSASCAKHLSHLPFMTFGMAKGLGVPRVLIAPTDKMENFLRKGTSLGDHTSCSMYVAVTRARSSVAIVSDRPARLGLPVWAPL